MKHFCMRELVRSATADKLGIDNTPDEDIMRRLEMLVDNTLDPLREVYGRPINVNSGYRCPELNKTVGGALNSGHMRGVAADITTGTKQGNKRLWDIIVKRNIPFTKMINEQGLSWIHISYEEGNVKREKLKGVKDAKGKWRYTSA